MRRFVWMVPAALAGAACASDGTRENGTWTPETAWHLEVAWTVGGADAEGDLAFGDVRGLAVDGAGRAWVLDYQAQHLVVLDTNGTLVRTVGRQGGGPGEFEGLYGVTVTTTQQVWTPDFRNARYTVFDTAGTRLETYRRPGTCRGYVWPGGATVDGAVREIVCTRVADRFASHVVRFVPEREAYADSLMVPLPVEDPPFYHFRFGDRESFFSVPFRPEQQWALAADGGVWVGWSDQYDIVRLNAAGDTVRRVGRRTDRVPVDHEERRARVGEILEAAQGQDVDQGLIPDVYPWFDRLVPDPDDYLWVLRRSTTTRWAFDVFDPTGTFLGSLAIPDGLGVAPSLPIVIRADRIWAVARDHLDAPVVVHLRIAGRN